MSVYLYYQPGPHQQYVISIEKWTMWYGYWVILGIASSIGLGTGLHTFVLFLGPHIAKVTLTSHTCNSLDFVVIGQDAFDCPDSTGLVTIWTIFQKICLESFFWGAGTSLGELPPYFVARAASMAGQHDDEFESIEKVLAKPKKALNWSEYIQLQMYRLMQTFGFFGILLCASIPNPLFDLAGIICGHFAVPFYTFFGATFVGKALIKSSIQSLFVILLFSKETLDFLLEELKMIYPSLHKTVKQVLDDQMTKFSKNVIKQEKKMNLLSVVWNGFLFLMIGYFLVSLVNSLANAEYQQEVANDKKKKKE